MKATLQTYQRSAGAGHDQLIMGNLDYVGRILSTMAFIVDEDAKENLHSAGVLGLVEAANRYDPSQGIPFRTFAYPRIRGAIVDELRKLSPVSQQVLEHIGIVRRTLESIEPPASPESVASASGLTVDQVNACLEAMRFIRPDGWNDLSDIVHGSWRKDPDSPDYMLESEELQQILASAIEELPERERLVLTLYYLEELNLAEIGSALDLSQSTVSRTLSAAKFRVQEVVKCKTQ